LARELPTVIFDIGAYIIMEWTMPNEIRTYRTEESDQFRFLHSDCLADLKGSVGLISVKVRQ
jgi:hypothetical protein